MCHFSTFPNFAQVYHYAVLFNISKAMKSGLFSAQDISLHTDAVLSKAMLFVGIFCSIKKFHRWTAD